VGKGGGRDKTQETSQETSKKGGIRLKQTQHGKDSREGGVKGSEGKREEGGKPGKSYIAELVGNLSNLLLAEREMPGTCFPRVYLNGGLKKLRLQQKRAAA